MERRNTISAVCFLAALAAGFLLVAGSFFGGTGALEGLLKQAWTDRDLQAVLEGAENAVNQDLDRDHLFIQLYGGVQRLSLRRVVEDPVEGNAVVKLSNGCLNFISIKGIYNAAPVAAANAAATAAFAQDLQVLGIPYRFLLAPQKIQPGVDLLPAGLSENGNENADAFLAGLEEAGVPYTDLRPLFVETGRYGDYFFRTDHHWKPEAAFYTWQTLVPLLEEAYGFSMDPALTAEDRWDTTVLEDFFLGSQGKRVGSLYAGVDDFTVYAPRFETELTYTCAASGMERRGAFSQSVCFPERIAQRDWFSANPYTYYAGGDYPLARIVNHKNPEGPRVVLLRESFACALTPFLSLSCSELATIDLRHFQGNLMETIRTLEPDLVLTLYTASTTGLDTMFVFDTTE